MRLRCKLIPTLTAACLSPAILSPGVSAQESDGPSARSIQVTPSDVLHWQEDAEFHELHRAPLYGNQISAEPYVYRLRAYAPARFPLHAHQRTEYITILQGTLHHAPAGGTRASAEACGAGCFIVIPPGQEHQGWLEPGTILQIHGVGPTEAHSPDRPESSGGTAPAGSRAGRRG